MPGWEPSWDWFPDAESWALLDSARCGDLESLAVLYRVHVGAVRRYLRSMVKNPELADDLTSEVFVRMLRSLGSVRRQEGKFRSWLTTIGRNIVFDHSKSRYHRTVIAMDAVPDTGCFEPSAEQVVLRHQAREVVWTGLAKLPADQRFCLCLRFLEGYSVTETAAEMGRSEGAVRQLQLRALRRLAALLEPETMSA